MKDSSPSAKHDKELYKQKLVKVSFFVENTLSYKLVLAAIFFNLAYSIVILDVMEVNFLMGLTVFINISMLFLLFTCAVKVRIYNKRWTFIALASGAYIALRIFVLIPSVLKPYSKVFQIYLFNVFALICIVIAFVLSMIRLTKREKLMDVFKNPAELAKAER